MLEAQLTWHEWSNGNSIRTLEYPLYSDSAFLGQIDSGLGPYSFINPVAHARVNEEFGEVRAAAILRIADYQSGPPTPDSGTTTAFYHGGSIQDELAALASLVLGVRVKAGGSTRVFEGENDRFGRPQGWSAQVSHFFRSQPDLIIAPSLFRASNLDDLKCLDSIPKIDADAFVALIKAARNYQAATWVVESDPNTAWLLLVAAIETAAMQNAMSKESYTEMLTRSLPKVVERLKRVGDPELIDDVAGLMADRFGVTGRFLRFVVDFLPNPPSDRPDRDASRCEWTAKNMKRAANLIYGYRSKALHTGTPFPYPMLMSAAKEPGTDKLMEVPLMGLGLSAYGGTWLPKDIPMNLNTFCYLTRGLLRNWWHSLCVPQDSN